MTVIVTKQFLEKGKTERGGWRSLQLAAIGISWPPQKGWQETIVGSTITIADAERFLRLSGRLKEGEIRQATMGAGDSSVVSRSKFQRQKTEERRNRIRLNMMALECQEEVKEQSYLSGLCLEIRNINFSRKHPNRRPNFHWFWSRDSDGKHVLDYWPSTGRWWIKETNEKGDDLRDPWEALERAQRVAAEV